MALGSMHECISHRTVWGEAVQMEEHRDKDGVDETEGRWGPALDAVQGRVMQGAMRDVEKDRWRIRFLSWVHWEAWEGLKQENSTILLPECVFSNQRYPSPLQLVCPSPQNWAHLSELRLLRMHLVLRAGNSLIQGHVGKWKTGGFYSRASEHWPPLARSSVFNSWWKGKRTFQMSLLKDTMRYCDFFNTLGRGS